jgi:hypothetical protein
MNELEAYATQTSVEPEQTISFCVYLAPDSTSSRQVTITIIREGASPNQVFQDTALVPPTLDHYPINCYQFGCNWPVCYSLDVPSGWRSGLYIARFDAANKLSTTVPFVVRPGRASTGRPIVMSLNFATWQAYNFWGGRGLYGYLDHNGTPVVDLRERATKISFDRPFLLSSDLLERANYFSNWELPFIRWMERQGFEADYCTSVDLHNDLELLQRYKLLVIVGHEEYWSREMRAHAEVYISGGGNVAFFAANTCWWQIRFDDNDRTLVCYKDNPDYIPSMSDDPLRPYVWRPWEYKDPLSRRDEKPLSVIDEVPLIYTSDAGMVTSNWKDVPWGLPEEQRQYENALTGVSFLFGGGWWDGTQPSPNELRPFFARGVNDPDFGWIFKDTGLQNGDAFGILQHPDETPYSVVQGECDGAEFDPSTTIPPLSRQFDPAAAIHTPSGLRILAVASLEDWWRHGGASTLDKAWATMIAYRNNGVVFNAATTDWAFGLSQDFNSWNVIDQITHNVLSELSQ